MKWSDIPLPWQACFEQAWLAYQAGCVPIGAAIATAEGDVPYVGRNHIQECERIPNQITGSELAHAEVNALLQFDRKKVDRYTCAIYATVEPCPLCLGAIYMTSLRNIHFAARDPFAGSTNLLGATPYLSRKTFHVYQDAPATLEALSVVLHTDFLYRSQRSTEDPVLASFTHYLPQAVKLAAELFRDDTLQRAAQSRLSLPELYERLLPRLIQ